MFWVIHKRVTQKREEMVGLIFNFRISVLREFDFFQFFINNTNFILLQFKLIKDKLVYLLITFPIFNIYMIVI